MASLRSSPRMDLRSTLPAEIHAATSQQHTELNRLITDRLKLALPPQASTPAVLGKGLAAFAEIFFVIENLWLELTMHFPPDGDQFGWVLPAGGVLYWLSPLEPEGLSRSERLRSDLQHIRLRTGMRRFDISPAQRAMFERMADELRERPHTFFAYTWVMYV